jgi:hypothetical protein
MSLEVFSFGGIDITARRFRSLSFGGSLYSYLGLFSGAHVDTYTPLVWSLCSGVVNNRVGKFPADFGGQIP